MSSPSGDPSTYRSVGKASVVAGKSSAKGSGKSGGKKRKSPLWARIFVVIGALTMVAAGGSMVSLNYLLGQVNGAVKQVKLIDHGTQHVSINGAINMLLVGLDTRPDNPGLGSRSDSIIIAHVPATHDRVYLVSIPRDTQVDIPPDPATGYRGGNDKINASFLFGSQHGGGDAGGFQLLQKTITNLTGITFQSGLIINFSGFTDIVTKLGGVNMYVDETTKSLHHGYLTNNPSVHAEPFYIDSHTGLPTGRVPGTTPVIYQKGFQHLSAYQALDYVRCRDFLPNADYDRERHQQQFIKALLQEAYDKGISNPLKISSFLSSLSKAFEFDGGGVSLDDWIFTLKGISPSALVTIKTNNGTYNTLVVNGQDRELLDATSLVLLHDVRDDKVDDFISAYPSWVAQS